MENDDRPEPGMPSAGKQQ